MLVLLRTGFVLLSLTMSAVSLAESRVIYGEDNRKDLYDPTNEEMLLEFAQSTAILIRDKDLSRTLDSTSRVKVKNETFKKSMGLCSDERFGEQLNPGFCSGFLVGPDLFVTAGHCVETQTMCNGISMIFGYGIDEEGKDMSSVSASDVYHCKSIVKQELGSGNEARDYAVLKLDRPVTGRAPLKMRRAGSVEVGDPMAVIGHPSGLPTKISAGATVRTVKASAPFFVTNLDTYGGNSGSAVFNTISGEVEGILVRGETDFDTDPTELCRRSRRCEENKCRGEDVTKTSIFVQYIPEL